MSIYKKLSIAAGGGIISTTQQADQVADTATILIGLGGTGIDCLRTIKTQVYSRLKPDNVDAVEKSYKHIRFLGVDTDDTTIDDGKKVEEQATAGANENQLALDSTELFSIANGSLKAALAAPATVTRFDTKWLSSKIDPPDLSRAGAGGIRQVGRFMMMDRSTAFISKIQSMVHSAKEGLTGGGVSVNIHIFSGLSGGTGSGAFLDVCYLIREAIKDEGNSTVFGYVFLPDVNLERISQEDTLTRQYIPKNGYAALQELDYCMHLSSNNGKFKQEYKTHEIIPWDKGPVDMCHLICATNQAGHVIPKAYDYAMHVTAEYVLDFLTEADGFGLASNLANFRQKVNQANESKVNGFYLDYCVIGAACARLPLREINTYLASELFEKFSGIGTAVPDKAAVEKLAIESMGPGTEKLSGVYEALWREIYNGATDGFQRFEDSWQNVIGNDDEMVRYYTDQKAAKENMVTTGAKSMVTATNEKSLIGRMRHYLERIICDVEKGPVYAYGMISAAQKNNLLNIIDGLIDENKSRWDQEAFQNRYKEYEYARNCFHNKVSNGLFDSNKKRFEEYRYRLEVLMQHQFWLSVFEKLDEVLNTFRKQVSDAADSYYVKLARVTRNLIETFKENRDTLHDPEMMKSEDAFAEPLVTIEELQDTLDEEVEKLDVPGLMNQFMHLFLSNDEQWLREDESEITKLVTDFFVKTAFADFASRSITRFLHDKYKTSTDSELASKVYNEWMVKLTNKASPLFFYDQAIWDDSKTGDIAYLSFPSTSGPVQTAAERMFETNDLFKPKPSNLTDRIYVMRSGCGLPLSSYKNCERYEREYFSSTAHGRHYYEGNPIEGMEFDDWRKLPSLTPRSLLKMDEIPDPLKKMVEEAEAIYDKVVQYHLLNDESELLCCEESRLGEFDSLLEEADSIAKKARKKDDVSRVEEMIQKLETAMDDIPLVKTGFSLANDGFAGREDVTATVRKDYFLSSPVIQIEAAKNIACLEKLNEAVKTSINELKNRIDEIMSPDQGAFIDALITGVLEYKGNVITYLPKDSFGEEAKCLSNITSDYPFGDVPPYQAYVSYKELSPETKKEISDAVVERRNTEDPEMVESIKTLANMLVQKNYDIWALAARNMAGKDEIIDFLKQLKDRYDIFVKKYIEE